MPRRSPISTGIRTALELSSTLPLAKLKLLLAACRLDCEQSCLRASFQPAPSLPPHQRPSGLPPGSGWIYLSVNSTASHEGDLFPATSFFAESSPGSAGNRTAETTLLKAQGMLSPSFALREKTSPRASPIWSAASFSGNLSAKNWNSSTHSSAFPSKRV